MVLDGDLFNKRFSSYGCIFCAILNNLARVIHAISNCISANGNHVHHSGSIDRGQQDDYTEIFVFGKKNELWSFF